MISKDIRHEYNEDIFSNSAQYHSKALSFSKWENYSPVPSWKTATILDIVIALYWIYCSNCSALATQTDFAISFCLLKSNFLSGSKVAVSRDNVIINKMLTFLLSAIIKRRASQLLVEVEVENVLETRKFTLVDVLGLKTAVVKGALSWK